MSSVVFTPPSLPPPLTGTQKREVSRCNLTAFRDNYYEFLEFVSFLSAKQVEGSFHRQILNMCECALQSRVHCAQVASSKGNSCSGGGISKCCCNARQRGSSKCEVSGNAL